MTEPTRDALPDVCPWCRKREAGIHSCYDAYALLEAAAVSRRKELDDLAEANWDMRKRLAMAEAEVERLRAECAAKLPPTPDLDAVETWIRKPRDLVVDIVASEIGDAIAAHDSGESVNPEARARHVAAAVRAECAAKLPPTPDLDAVVARQRLDRIYEATAEGEYNVSEYCDARDALLAAVSRPAEARGDIDLGAADSTATFWRDADVHGNGVRNLARAYLALRAALAAERVNP